MDFSYLSSLTPEQFEIQRAIIINEHIKNVPAEHKRDVIQTQAKLDAIREHVSSDEFMAHLMNELADSTNELNHLVNKLNDVTGRGSSSVL